MSKKREINTGMNENEIKESAEEKISAENNFLPVEENAVDESTHILNELLEQKDKYIRLLAEFENYKRRTSKERLEFFKMAGQDVIKDLLPVLDDADRAETIINEAKDIAALKQGLLLIREKLKNILLQKGLKEIDTIGIEFDTETMESVTEIETPSGNMKGKVVDVVEKGYTLNDKIIRHAKVVVGK